MKGPVPPRTLSSLPIFVACATAPRGRPHPFVATTSSTSSNDCAKPARRRSYRQMPGPMAPECVAACSNALRAGEDPRAARLLGSFDGYCVARCGNGFCEVGEDHASCPSDCCDARPDGTCAAVCGNGFCEVGEDHASCPHDCCELGPNGACAAVCGNGFCEVGENHANCPGDCCEAAPDGSCLPVCGNGFCEVGEDHASCPGDCM